MNKLRIIPKLYLTLRKHFDKIKFYININEHLHVFLLNGNTFKIQVKQFKVIEKYEKPLKLY